MIISFQKWVSLLSAVGAMVLSASPALATSDLLTCNGATAPLFAPNAKICVVSQNTGLAMWYNLRNHGFVETKAIADRNSGFATPEELLFGFEHQMAPVVFSRPGMIISDLGDSPMNQFLAEATRNVGTPTGLIFTKDGSIYTAAPTPDCDLSFIDPCGLLAEATLNDTNSIPTSVAVILKVKTVPEPSSLALIALACVAAAGSRRFRGGVS